MNELQLGFDYAALDAPTQAFVQERTERIHNLARMTAAGIVQIGQYLGEVKERLGHGQFLEWIKREFAWGRTSAWGFMQAYDKFKCSDFEHMEIDASAMFLIAAPSTPEPVRQEALRRAGNGEGVTHSGARALVQRFVETGEMPEVNISLPELIEERRRQRAVLMPAPVISKQGAEEARKYHQMLAERAANTARVAALMGVIQAINLLAKTPLSVREIAAEIKRFDTPDQDWRGNAGRAYEWMTSLLSEMKL